ncbi:Uncharacterised protein [Serratia fonticola]|uniref:Uncharacterized protein n=1 Tax=Serratia fonticola TaxID=47917 RepID=A0A4U9W1A6_SERFO|nr:Uncharacterised protein [Serratia fonticola]
MGNQILTLDARKTGFLPIPARKFTISVLKAAIRQNSRFFCFQGLAAKRISRIMRTPYR